MISIQMMSLWVVGGVRRLRGRDPERGDVPGWVMVTVMTAGLVVILFAAFRGPITKAVTDAIENVTNNTK
jgi:hypothetical protein